MDKSDLAVRMKEYEFVSRHYLTRRVPVMIRCDMRAGHSFTKGFERPFDNIFIKSMQETAKYMCENIQGCVMAYTQSDEITLVLIDYKNINSSAWFDYRADKVISIAASMSTMAFNKFFAKEVHDFRNSMKYDDDGCLDKYEYNLWTVYHNAVDQGAMFDARAFNIPKEEVTNCVYWRQQDATRNSVQMVGQANFSHKELQNKSCNDIQDMLMTQKNINWNDLPTYQKRGSCCIREYYEIDSVMRTRWVIDTEIPLFKGDGRQYIEKLIHFE